MTSEELKRRFWPNVRQGPGCWVWNGDHDTKGYPRMMVRYKSLRVQRVAVLLDGRDLPEGLVVDHLCRNHGCVRPDHLRVVSNKTNVLAGVGITAHNARKTTCVNGHALSGENIRITSRGRRYCLRCNRLRANGHDRLRYETWPNYGTHCKRGHALSGDNLYVRPNGRKMCRACARARRRSIRALIPKEATP